MVLCCCHLRCSVGSVLNKLLLLLLLFLNALTFLGYECVHIPMRTHMEARVQCDMSSLVSFHLNSLKQILSLNQGLANSVWWLTSKALGSVYLCLLRTRSCVLCSAFTSVLGTRSRVLLPTSHLSSPQFTNHIYRHSRSFLVWWRELVWARTSMSGVWRAPVGISRHLSPSTKVCTEMSG